MQATTGPSWLRRAAVMLIDGVATTVVVTLQAVRLLLFAVLSLFEPIVRVVLSLLALGGFAVSALYWLTRPSGHQPPYAFLLIFASGCALVIVLYRALLRWLQPTT